MSPTGTAPTHLRSPSLPASPLAMVPLGASLTQRLCSIIHSFLSFCFQKGHFHFPNCSEIGALHPQQLYPIHHEVLLSRPPKLNSRSKGNIPSSCSGPNDSHLSPGCGKTLYPGGLAFLPFIFQRQWEDTDKNATSSTYPCLRQACVDSPLH